MNGQERIALTMRHREPDRVPVMCQLSLGHYFLHAGLAPEEIWHEGGVWNSGRVKDCLDLLQIRRQRVHSPHAKAAVEGRFNKLWTVLSVHTAGQIGRFRGAREQEDALLESCRGGHTDPWDHVENAMALTAAGLLEPARAAFDWCRTAQRADGSWPMRRQISRYQSA